MALVFHHPQLIMSKIISFPVAGNRSVSSLVCLLPPSPDHFTFEVNGFQPQALSSSASFLQTLELVLSSVVELGGDEQIMGMSIKAVLLPQWI